MSSIFKDTFSNIQTNGEYGKRIDDLYVSFVPHISSLTRDMISRMAQDEDQVSIGMGDI